MSVEHCYARLPGSLKVLGQRWKADAALREQYNAQAARGFAEMKLQREEEKETAMKVAMKKRSSVPDAQAVACWVLGRGWKRYNVLGKW